MPRLQWIVGPGEGGVRLDKFLAAAGRLGSRRRAIAGLERGKVYINAAEVGIAEAGQRLTAGEVVAVWPDRPGSRRRRPQPGVCGPLHIVYEDDVLLVVNKPAGLLTVPLERKGPLQSVYTLLTERFRSHGKRRPFVVHRIDQDSSGLVVFAKDAHTQKELQNQFKRREPERVYIAVVHGHVRPREGTWRDRLVWDSRALVQKAASALDPRGKEAVCEYRVLETFDRCSLIEVRLRTGRRNQIRIQAALRGHSLIGEERYVQDQAPIRPIKFGRQALHAFRLSFAHPVDGRRLDFEGPLPPDLLDLLARLRRRSRLCDP
jgi:23S rRNA pseudouridine1911/1915/1917 synthase